MAFRMCEKSRSRCAILSRYKTSDCRGKSRSFRLSLICFEVGFVWQGPKFFYETFQSQVLLINVSPLNQNHFMLPFSQLSLDSRNCVLIVLTVSSLEVFSLIFRIFYSPILMNVHPCYLVAILLKVFLDKSRQDIFEHLQADPCQAPSVCVFFLKNHLCVLWSNLRN